jgi:F-type H+-transporting ATPase subunit c
MSDRTILALASIITAGLIMAVGALGAAAGESRISVAGVDALARQPDEAGTITRNQFVALAMVESTAIFCLVIALVLLFANPYLAEG